MLPSSKGVRPSRSPEPLHAQEGGILPARPRETAAQRRARRARALACTCNARTWHSAAVSLGPYAIAGFSPSRRRRGCRAGQRMCVAAAPTELADGPRVCETRTDLAGAAASEGQACGDIGVNGGASARNHTPGGLEGASGRVARSGDGAAGSTRPRGQSRRPASRSSCSNRRRSPHLKDPASISSREPSSVGLRCVST